MSFRNFLYKNNKRQIMPSINPTEIFFNIIVRFEYNEQNEHISKCLESILNQTYKKIKIFVIITDEKCIPLLEKYKNIVTTVFLRTKTSYEGYSNLYYNNIFKKIKNGWLIFMDFFNAFESKTSLLTIYDNISNNKSFCIWKYNKENEILFNLKTKDIELCTIAFHHSIIKNTIFVPGENNLQVFLKTIIGNNKLNFKFIEHVLVNKHIEIQKEETKKVNFLQNDKNNIEMYKIEDEKNYNYNFEYLSSINNNLKSNLKLEKKPTVIIFSMINYYFRIQRNQHIARILAENGFQVFYLKTTVVKKKNIVSKINNNLYEVNLYCDTNNNISVYKSKLSKNDILSLRESIISLQIEYNFNYFISYICNPFWYQLIKYIPNSGVIFDCLDYTKGFNSHSNLILTEEEEAIKKEYTIFTSPKIKEKMISKNNNLKLIRNGCDFIYFNKIKKYNNKRKIIGYYGAISDWFDIDLITYIVNEFQDCDFHLIGSTYCIDKTHQQKIDNLNNLNNVTLFGEIPYNELYNYINKFDIGLIPFIINDLIECTNPVKLYEMLSIGLPIVMVNLPDVLTLEKDHLYYLSKNKFEFKENIKKILLQNENKNIIEERIKYASENTWNKRVEKVIEIIEYITPSVSIVLLCWNNWEITKKCIESVIQNTNYNYFELIIVNNNSTDETKEELKQYEKYNFIKVINNCKNYGFAKGMNIGAIHCNYELIVLLNNDTIVSKNWLYPLVKPLVLGNYNCGSPITNNCGNEVKQFIYYEDVNDLMNKSKILQFNKIYKHFDIDRIPFFSPIIKKKMFYKVGMLDEKYGRGGWEDDDILKKFKLLNPDSSNFYTYGSFVYHMETATLGNEHYHQNNNKNIFEKKWNEKWIPHSYYMPKLKINVQTNITSILNYTDNNLYKDDKTNGLIITNNKNKKNSLIVLKDNKDQIILKYNNYLFKLNKIEWNIHKMYAIINTSLNSY